MFNLSTEKTVILHPNVKQIFEKYKKTLPGPEAGGILFGRVFPNNFILIEEAIEPSINDKSGYDFFERDIETAQQIINQRWKDSNGKSIYIGEWHTHNERKPSPSSRDKNMIKNMLNQSVMEIDFLITIIVGMEVDFTGLQTQKALKPLKVSNNPFIFGIENT